MEQYAAEGSRPVERCNRDVELADAYVLILGWCYGYVPKTDDPGGMSITQIEYQHAVSNGKTVLAFLLDPETPWPPSSMDSASADATAAARINEFRSEVAGGHLAGVFSSPEDLASQVGAVVASFGLTKPLSELVLNRTAVTADAMPGFVDGAPLEDTSLLAVQEMILRTGKDRALVVSLGMQTSVGRPDCSCSPACWGSPMHVRQVAFTGRGGAFVGMASPGALVEGLSSRFPELNAFAQRLQETAATEDRLQEISRQVDVWKRCSFRRRNLSPDEKQRAPREPRGRSGVQPSRPERELQVGVGVREELLQEWLGERLDQVRYSTTWKERWRKRVARAPMRCERPSKISVTSSRSKPGSSSTFVSPIALSATTRRWWRWSSGCPARWQRPHSFASSSGSRRTGSAGMRPSEYFEHHRPAGSQQRDVWDPRPLLQGPVG